MAETRTPSKSPLIPPSPDRHGAITSPHCASVSFSSEMKLPSQSWEALHLSYSSVDGIELFMGLSDPPFSLAQVGSRDLSARRAGFESNLGASACPHCIVDSSKLPQTTCTDRSRVH